MRLAIAFVLVARVAAAKPDAFVDLVAPVGDAAPAVRATVIGAQGPCTLHDGDVAIASREEAGFDTAEPIAIVIVVNDQQLMVARFGDNNEHTPDDDVGPIDRVKLGFDRFDFTKLGGGWFAVVGYATGAEVMRPFAPLAELKGKALGDRTAYVRRLGTDLVKGIALGLDMLASEHAPRKAMVVIGDGNDTDNEAARDVLVTLAARAHALHVQTFALITKTVVSSDGNVVAAFAETHDAPTPDATTRALADVMRALVDRRTLVFSGDQLHWDGAVHAVTLSCGGVRIGPLELALAPAWTPATRSKLPFLVIGLALVAIATTLVILIRRRR